MSTNKINLHYSLIPISLLYSIGIWIRNLFFDWGILRSETYPIPVISIGNLSVGGTGKTPHTEYIIRLLKDKYRIAVLSRGYKRKTSGFILATSNSSCREIGDEPFQMKNKFPDILIAVDANRRRGIQTLLSLPQEKKPEIILLDDAYQHRYVHPSLSIVLSDFHRLFYLDKLLPVGRFRESAKNINRADIIIITKCDKDIKPIDFRIIENNIKLKAHQSLYFTSIAYGEIAPLFPTTVKSLNIDKEKNDEVLLISGIANPTPFIQEAKRNFPKVKSVLFADHHTFSKADFKKLNTIFEKMNSSNKIILVTEKDAARLMNNPLVPESWKKYLYYLPITIQFRNKDNFDEIIKRHIITILKNYNLHK